MAEFKHVRIHAGMMSELDQRDFVYMAIGKVLHMLADQGIEPENLVSGLMKYVKEKTANTSTEMVN